MAVKLGPGHCVVNSQVSHIVLVSVQSDLFYRKIPETFQRSLQLAWLFEFWASCRSTSSGVPPHLSTVSIVKEVYSLLDCILELEAQILQPPAVSNPEVLL